MNNLQSELVAVVSDAGLIHHVGRVTNDQLQLLNPETGQYDNAVLADCSLVKLDQHWHDALYADLAEVGPGGSVLLASAEDSTEITLPDGSKKFAVVLVDDPGAVTDLIAIAPGPHVYKWAKAQWVEDAELLDRLRSIQPPKLVTLNEQVASSVASQINANEGMVATARALQVISLRTALVAAPALTAGLGHSPRGAENLREYWIHGKGALKIRWGTPGDWKRCVRQLTKYLGPRAKGYCQLRHKEATGMWTGDKEHRAMSAAGELLHSDNDSIRLRAAKEILDRSLVAAGGTRIVRTAEGARWYNQPIGSVIVKKSYLKGPLKAIGKVKKGDVIESAQDPKRKIGVLKTTKSGGSVEVRGVDVDNATNVEETFPSGTKVQTFSEDAEGVKARISAPKTQEVGAPEKSKTPETPKPPEEPPAPPSPPSEPPPEEPLPKGLTSADLKPWYIPGMDKSPQQYHEQLTDLLAEKFPNADDDTKSRIQKVLERPDPPYTYEEVGSLWISAQNADLVSLTEIEDIAPLMTAQSLLPHIREDGRLTVKRAKLHKKIINQPFKGRSAVPPEQTPRFVMLGGGPAGGKSTTLKRLDQFRGFEDEAVVINPDDVKEILPEYKKHQNATDDRVRKGAATFVHEESSMLGKAMRAKAVGERFHVLSDAVNAKAKTAGEIEKLKTDDGYRVEWVGVTVPPQVAIERAELRGIREKRFVNPGVIASGHQSTAQNYEKIAEVADSSTLTDTTTNEMIARDGVVLDEKAYADFKTRGGSFQVDQNRMALLHQAYEDEQPNPDDWKPNGLTSWWDDYQRRRALEKVDSWGGSFGATEIVEDIWFQNLMKKLLEQRGRLDMRPEILRNPVTKDWLKAVLESSNFETLA